MLQARSRILLAFPGMGKTPLAKRVSGYVDADFGNYRSYMHVEKFDESKLLLPFAQFIGSMECKAILTNEPKLAKFIHIDHMYLPEDLTFSARKMGVDTSQIEEWVKGWLNIARQFRIPITLIHTGLDNYLK